MNTPATMTRVWQVDIPPVRTMWCSIEKARPALLMVADGSRMLHAEIIVHPPSEDDEIAALVERGLDEAVKAEGKAPNVVETVYPTLQAALHQRLAPRGIAVACTESLPELGAAYRSPDAERFLTEVEEPGPSRVGAPAEWGGWGWSETLVEELFAALAEFYRSAPWDSLDEYQVLGIALPRGDLWQAVVLGRGGGLRGLLIFSNPKDLSCIPESLANPPPGSRAGNPVFLSFSPADDVHAQTRDEIVAAGWELAPARLHIPI